MSRRRAAASTLVVLLLGGCMAAKQPAPVVQRTPEPVRTQPAKPPAPQTAPQATPRAPGDPRPDTYTVKRGDTLLGIALDHGLDYRDLARWNQLANPNVIEVGQVLRLREPTAQADARAGQTPAQQPSQAAPGDPVVSAYQTPAPVQAKPLTTDATPAQPTPPAPAAEKRETTPPAPPPAASAGGIITAPQATRLPYSQAAVEKLQAASPELAAPAMQPAPVQKPETAAAEGPDELPWGWPTKGTVVAGFNENGGPKGVQIAGSLGQPVVASAPGRVVYTGSGLRGYGNLVIIKHNNTYLSAYAHNRSVLVKQGDNVSKGQKIAEMGDSDASRVMLHFEIRRLGKPVDPMKLLPPS